MINKTDWERLTNKQRARIKAYINFLLWLQRVPVLHGFIKGLGDLVFYRL